MARPEGVADIGLLRHVDRAVISTVWAITTVWGYGEHVRDLPIRGLRPQIPDLAAARPSQRRADRYPVMVGDHLLTFRPLTRQES